MNCPVYKKLCNQLIISTGVTFSDNTLIINIPQANYNNNEKYCVVVAQTIPSTTTVTAPVVITIGTDTTQYPLVNSDCTPTLACAINTRTRYSVCVHTTTTSGTFRLIGRIPCSQCSNNLSSLPITTTTSVSTTTTTATGG